MTAIPIMYGNKLTCDWIDKKTRYTVKDEFVTVRNPGSIDGFVLLLFDEYEYV